MLHLETKYKEFGLLEWSNNFDIKGWRASFASIGNLYLPRRISKWTPVIRVINWSVTSGSGLYGAADGEVEMEVEGLIWQTGCRNGSW